MVYSLAILFSVAMVSCGGNKAAEADTVDTAVVEEEVVEVVADSNDTTVVAEGEVAAETPAEVAPEAAK